MKINKLIKGGWCEKLRTLGGKNKMWVSVPFLLLILINEK